MDFILPKLLYWQLLVTPQLPETTFDGQTIIVTGGNSGLGLEAVRHFVKMDAKRVIIACRSVSKGQAAKADIEASTGRTGVVDVMEVDLASYASVKSFATQVNALDRLDVIVENAGIQTTEFEMVEEDESTITVNVVSTFLMALLVLPKLQESASKFGISPRLCIMSSEVHFMTNINKELKNPSFFDALRDKKQAQMGFNRYAQSKLIEVLYCRALAAKMNESGQSSVILNYVNPGLCHSSLGGDAGRTLPARIFKGLLARSTEVGARTEVAAAAQKRDSHGTFINNGVISQWVCPIIPLFRVNTFRPSVFVRSEQGRIAEQRIYEELNAKLEKIHPGITRNI
ncbi:MAG: hypothetical protein GOMPHAMPRED_005256 [Gomphillus americanus]|uniref:NAD(P)-binding protein n=1 Tax=Gomphillus americanus TaxID=1940652 RepID=A0A8H3IUU5_9LECA|nr:MAG: hypothetical protein GOMPHAMPRED_005256 [Gomphillus americanus]